MYNIYDSSPMDFYTLDDFDVKKKTVFVRVDINSPLDPDTLAILDTSRIQSVTPTIQELYEKKAKTVILAHQGRPGSWDFTPLKNHAKALQKILGVPIIYVDDIYGRKAQQKIKHLHAGDIILLKNVRQYTQEMEKKKPQEHATTDMVTSLAPLGDIFINDAFAAAHRSQCSLVGFTPVLPSGAGRLLEKEITTLTQLTSHPQKPVVFILGGAKYSNILPVMDAVLSRGIADWVLLAGIPSLAFLEAQSYILGEKNILGTKDEKEDIQGL
ncbi:MAG: phosphoglycerate kinase, partial [Candidatus Aminicenantes bacterium]|nr:phosphoglycerate kinase [Candidatus Aminicenantes bacterium]